MLLLHATNGKPVALFLCLTFHKSFPGPVPRKVLRGLSSLGCIFLPPLFKLYISIENINIQMFLRSARAMFLCECSD